MKISVVGTRGIPNVMGGVETHCENLYPLISELGMSVRLFARSPYVDYKNSDFKGVELQSIWAPKKKTFEAIVHTFWAIVRSRIIGSDVIHLHAIGPGIMVPFAKLLGLKVVFTHHGPDYDRGKWGKVAKSILKLGEKLAVKYADEVIVISKVIEKIIEKKYGRNDSNLIPNGVNKPNPLGNSATYLEKHSLSEQKYIVCVGRFVPEKGFHDILKAFSEIDTSYKLVIVGDSDHPSDYSTALKKNAVNVPNVILTGFIQGDELQSIFANAALFAMPSYHEGLPIALLEAMSFGLPTLVSDIPANLEVGLEPDCYFKTGDIQDLKQKLISKQCGNISRVDYSKWMGRYDWGAIASQTVALYKRMLEN